MTRQIWKNHPKFNSLLGDGTTNNSLIPERIVPGSVLAVAAGQGHCLFLKSDGSVWASGYDGVGCLGDGFTNAAVLRPQQVFPLPKPILTAAVIGASGLQFTATCPQGGIYYLLAGTNLSQPASEWSRAATNTVRDRYNNTFSATLTNVITGGNQKYYMLQSP